MKDLESRFSEIRNQFGELVQLLEPIRWQNQTSTRAKTRAETRRNRGNARVQDEITHQVGPSTEALSKRISDLQHVLEQFEADLRTIKHDSASSAKPQQLKLQLRSEEGINTPKETSAAHHPATETASSRATIADASASSVSATKTTPGSELNESGHPPEAESNPTTYGEVTTSTCESARHDRESSAAATDEYTDDASRASTEITTPDNTSSARGRNGFVLTHEDMGTKLVQTVTRFLLDPTFRGRLTVKGPLLDATRDCITPGEADVFGVEYGGGGKTCNMWSSRQESSFQWPDFDNLPDRPSDDEARAFLESIVSAPPKHPISYYGGGGTSPLHDVLHPGATLAGCEELQVANSTFYHIGAAGSGTAFHCEDAEFLSCNITDVGYKIWLVIRLDSTATFEKYIRGNWSCGECDQFARHLCLLIAPSTLEREGIEFDVHCAGPGEMIITRPRQYHAVVNFSSCIARSINFLPDGQPLVPKGLCVCEQDGLYGLHKTHPVQLVPPPGTLASPDVGRATSKRKTLPSSAANPRVKSPRTGKLGDSLRKHLLELDPSIPISSTCPPAVLKLAAPILGTFSSLQLGNLHKERQQTHTEAQAVPKDTNIYHSLESQVTFLRDVVSKTNFHKCKARIIQYLIATKIDETKQRRGRIRAEPTELNNIADKLWPHRKDGRIFLDYHLERGRKWKRLCGSLIGLLAIIPLSSDNTLGIKPAQYLELQDEAIEAFRRLFEGKTGTRLCSEGAHLVDLIMSDPA